MKKGTFLVIFLFTIALFSTIGVAEEKITSNYLTYMNGKWYYLDEKELLQPILMMRDGKLNKDKVFSDKCAYDNEHNYIHVNGFSNDGKNIIILDAHWKNILRIEQDRVETICSITGNIPNNNATIAVCGNYLFAKFNYVQTVFRIDMQDGSIKILPWKNVINFFAMSDGNLLVHHGLSKDAPEKLQVYNSTNCKEQNIIAEFEGNTYPSVAYNVESNRVYAAFNASIYMLEHGEWHKLRNFQFSNNAINRKKVLCNGTVFYVYNDKNNEWYGSLLDQDIDLTQIVIGGSHTLGRLDSTYMKFHPNQVVVKKPSLNLMSALDLYTRLLSKDDEYDIYAIMYNSGVRKLIEQGILQPLKGNAFDNYRQSLYKPIQNELSINNELFAVFESSSIFNFTIDKSQDIEPPTSMDSLIDMLEKWSENPQNRGQALLVHNGNCTVDNEALLLMCLHQIIYYNARGQELWKEPKIISLLERIRNTKLAPSQELTMDIADKAVIHFTIGNVTLFDNDGLQPPLLLLDNLPMLIPMETSTVLLINPYAKHVKEATEYLAYICDNTILENQRLLFSTLESKLQDCYAEEIKNIQAQIKYSTSESERQQLSADIESIKNDYRNYTASPVTLSMYRKNIVPQLMLDIPLLMTHNSSISIRGYLQEQAYKYLHKQIDTITLLNNIQKWIEISNNEGL